MSTAATFRKLALAQTGAIESAHMGHPDFRAGGRIFASLSPDAATGTVKLTPEQQQAMLAAQPAAFRPAAGAWGRSGWTTILLAAAPRPVLVAALELAHENVMSQPVQKAAAKKKAAGRQPGQAGKSNATKAPTTKLATPAKRTQTPRAARQSARRGKGTGAHKPGDV